MSTNLESSSPIKGLFQRKIPRQTEISERERMLVFIAIGLGTFGVGVAEFVVMGLLRNIAETYQISEAQAGIAIAVYAFGVMLGAPLITAFTGRIPRRRLVLALLIAFVVGNGLTALAMSFEFMIVGRFIAGLPHGAFFSVTSLVVASLAREGARGRALAFVGMGFPLSSLIGVPLAQALGQATIWNAAYVFVTLIGLATLLMIWFVMPHMTEMPATSPLEELSSLKRIQVWLSLAIGSVGFGGMFAVYTYISWTLTKHAGLSPNLVWLALSIYGVGMVIGNWLGGRLSDWSVEYGIFVSLAAISISLTSFYFLSGNVYTAIINFAVLGGSASMLIPSLQLRLMDVAGKAKTLASSLNHSALNIANAAGASIGGAVIAAGYSYAAPALVGAGLGALAILLWAGAFALRRKAEGIKG